MSVRNEPKFRSEMFREKGWKGVKRKHDSSDISSRI
jgi:hypothetical protein